MQLHDLGGHINHVENYSRLSFPSIGTTIHEGHTICLKDGSVSITGNCMNHSRGSSILRFGETVTAETAIRIAATEGTRDANILLGDSGIESLSSVVTLLVKACENLSHLFTAWNLLQ